MKTFLSKTGTRMAVVPPELLSTRITILEKLSKGAVNRGVASETSYIQWSPSIE